MSCRLRSDLQFGGVGQAVGHLDPVGTLGKDGQVGEEGDAAHDEADDPEDGHSPGLPLRTCPQLSLLQLYVGESWQYVGQG